MPGFKSSARYVINRIVEPFGYVLRPRSEIFDPSGGDDRFANILAQVKPYTMVGNEKLYSLYMAVRYVVTHDIPGDLVECGVLRGGCPMLMALTLTDMGAVKKIWLYDTFEGIPKPTEADGETVLKTWRERQREHDDRWLYASLEDVKVNLARSGYANLEFVKGRVEDTIPDRVPEKIALLRLDTDLYESTRHEMIHLFPRLVSGGVFIADDYGSWVGARKAVDEYMDEHDAPMLLHRVQASAIAVKR